MPTPKKQPDAMRGVLERTLAIADVRLRDAVPMAEKTRVEAARSNEIAFIEYVIRDASRRPIVCEGFHREWHSHIDAHARAYIEAPRDHGKTAQMIGRILYEIGRNPNIRIKILCQGDATAKKRLAVIKTYIDNSAEYKRVFPHVKRSTRVKDWSASTITVERDGTAPDPTVEAVGITTAGTGGRADLILADDVVDERNAITQPALREVVKEHFFNVWTNLLEPDGRVIFICTPWHSADLTQDLKKGNVYAVLSHTVGPNFEPVWPSKWPAEALKLRRDDIGQRRFDRAFRAVVYSDEELTFQRSAITRAVSRVKTISDVPRSLTRYMGIDLAISKLTGAAWTVFFVAGVDDDGYRYPLQVVRRRIGSVATACWALALHGRHELELAVVESNQYQAAILEWIEVLRKSGAWKSDTPPEGISAAEWAWMRPCLARAVHSPPRFLGQQTGSQKASEDVGLPALAAEIATDLWRVNLGPGHGNDVGDGLCSCDWCHWLAELAAHPAARFSDCVMGMWLCHTAMRSTGGRVQIWMPELESPSPQLVAPESTIAALSLIGFGQAEVAERGICGTCAFRSRDNLCRQHRFIVRPQDIGCEEREALEGEAA